MVQSLLLTIHVMDVPKVMSKVRLHTSVPYAVEHKT